MFKTIKKGKISIIILMLIALFMSPLALFSKVNGQENDELPKPSLNKEAVNINYSDKTIKYEITFNEGKLYLEDAYLEDIFDMLGLVFKEDSLTVTDVSNNTILDVNVDYKIITGYSDGTPYEDGGYDIEFINDYSSFDSHIKIEYLANYDLYDLINGNEFVNEVFLSYKFMDFPQAAEESVMFSSSVPLNEISNKNGSKSATYDEATNTITWVVNINYNRLSGQIGFYDDLVNSGEYVDNSLRVYKYDVNPDWSINVDSSEYNDYTKNTIPNGSSSEMALTIQNDDASGYQIVYKTTLEGDTPYREFNNTAEFGINDQPFILEKSYFFKDGNHMEKMGERLGDTITWTLLANRAETGFEELVIYDSWDNQQSFVDGSIVVYPMQADASGQFIFDLNNPLTEGVDYNIIENPTPGVNAFEIEFASSSNKAYMVRLETKIDPSLEGVLELKNYASIYDRWAEDPLKNSEDEAIFEYDNRDRSTFVVKKVDEENNPIEGVKLVLADSQSEDYEAIYTDEYGFAVFSDKLYGTYILYEDSSPEGYNIPQEYLNGVEVEISEEVNSDIIALEIVNEKTKVVLSKMNAMEEAISNATFRLEKMTEDGYEIVSEHLLTVDGEIIVRGLSEGKYRFIETKAAEGYVRNEKNYEFTLTADEMGNIDDYYITAINYKGSVELLKTDENDNPLENVVFDLYDEDDNLIKADLVTNEDGKITVEDLAPNTYYFKEKKTVDGYKLDDKLHVFTVEESSLDKPEKDMLTVVNEKVKEKAPQPEEDHGELPSTGIDNSTGVFITVISVSVVYIGYVLYKKRKLR